MEEMVAIEVLDDVVAAWRVERLGHADLAVGVVDLAVTCGALAVIDVSGGGARLPEWLGRCDGQRPEKDARQGGCGVPSSCGVWIGHVLAPAPLHSVEASGRLWRGQERRSPTFAPGGAAAGLRRFAVDLPYVL